MTSMAKNTETLDTITLERYKVSDANIMHLLDRMVEGLANSYHQYGSN